MLPLVPIRVQFVHVIFVASHQWSRWMLKACFWENGVFGRVTLSRVVDYWGQFFAEIQQKN